MVNTVNRRRRSALMMASGSGRGDVIFFLLSQGADVCLRTGDGFYAVDLVGTVESHTHNGCDLKRCQQVLARASLLDAARHGKHGMIQNLVDTVHAVASDDGDSLEERPRTAGDAIEPLDINVRDDDGCTALMLCAANDDDKGISILMNCSTIDLYARGPAAQTALIFAAERARSQTVLRILRQCASLLEQDRAFGTADEGDEAAMDLADFLDLCDDSGSNALMKAAQRGQIEVHDYFCFCSPHRF